MAASRGSSIYADLAASLSIDPVKGWPAPGLDSCIVSSSAFPPLPQKQSTRLKWRGKRNASHMTGMHVQHQLGVRTIRPGAPGALRVHDLI